MYYKDTSSPEPVYTLITGASQGLGKAFARECAKRKMNLLLVSLPGEDLPELCRDINQEFGVDVQCLEIDLAKPDGPSRVYHWAVSRYRVNMLINNAGIGGSRKYDECSIDYIDTIIMLNIRTVALLTKLLIGELKNHSRSYILNISSIAAFSPVPFKTVYPASKSFIYSFSRGLREELRETPVKVAVIHPGPIMTNPEVTERIRRQGMLARLTILPAEQVARIALKRSFKGHTVITPGFFNKLCKWMMKSLPVRLRISIASRALRRELDEKRKYVKKIKVA
ncbi:MAG TPA: SDR family NAD(P)-dependent oxidoreductase [Bacteroidetes bacterium]|nr:SDR family NAD(P)-dependent oxidoreductase [Bacteroidota bacterium]